MTYLESQLKRVIPRRQGSALFKLIFSSNAWVTLKAQTITLIVVNKVMVIFSKGEIIVTNANRVRKANGQRGVNNKVT